MTHETPRIYVACLASYVSGVLHGGWINCDQDADCIQQEIDDMLAASPSPDAEEWAIHDTENWQDIELSENEDIELVASLAQMLIEHGKAFAVYYQSYGFDAGVEGFENRYSGQYKNESDFVYSTFEQEGKIKQLKELGLLESYIDWEAIARDWFVSDYDSFEVGFEETYVFSCH